jgi:hypothetical protein
LRRGVISFILRGVTRQGCKPVSELDSRVCHLPFAFAKKMLLQKTPRLQRNRRKTVD